MRRGPGPRVALVDYGDGPRRVLEWSTIDLVETAVQEAALVGSAPLDRLRWVIGFAFDKFPSSASPEWEKIVAEAMGFSVLNLESRRLKIRWQGEESYPDPREIARVQAAGRKTILAKLDDRDAKGRSLEVAEIAEIAARANRSKVYDEVRRVYFEPTFRNRFLGNLNTLLDHVGHRLRRCPGPGCGKVFVKWRRSEHCSPECGNRKRVQAYRERLRKDKAKREARLAAQRLSRKRAAMNMVQGR